MGAFGMGRPMVSMAIFVASMVKTFCEGFAFNFSRTSFGSLLVLMMKTASSFAFGDVDRVEKRRVHDGNNAGVQHRAMHPEDLFADAVIGAKRCARAFRTVFRECLHVAAAGEARVREYLGRGDGTLPSPSMPSDLDHFCHDNILRKIKFGVKSVERGDCSDIIPQSAIRNPQ
jgi:hypothetical protein